MRIVLHVDCIFDVFVGESELRVLLFYLEAPPLVWFGFNMLCLSLFLFLLHVVVFGSILLSYSLLFSTSVVSFCLTLFS